MNNLQQLINNYRITDNEFERQESMAQIIAECEQTMTYFGMQYSNLPIDREDIRAELLIVLVKCVGDYESEFGQFKTYFSKCCKSRLNNLHRDLKRQKRNAVNEEGEFLYPISYEELVENGYNAKGYEEYEGTVNSYEDIEIMMLLDSLDLAEHERLICEGFAKGLKSVEIAERLSVTPAMVTYHLKRIRQKFEANLIFC